jgi:alpha-galactosidase
MRKLDLSKPGPREFVKSELVRVIDRYGLDLVRFDLNIDTREGGNRGEGDAYENVAWRNVEEMYAIVSELRDLYPDVQFENCAGGGGRTDIGMVGRCSTTWVSDWMRMPRTVRILNGMSMVLPPEYIDRMAGAAMEGGMWGGLETGLHVAVLAHPTLSSISLRADDMDPAAAALIRKYVRLYKDFIRTFLPESLVWHHAPVVPGVDANGWCALEYSSEDRRKAVAGVFRLAAAQGSEYRFRFRGLDPSARYRLTVLPGDAVHVLDGSVLMREGLAIALDSPLSSRLLLAEAAPDAV